MSIMKMAGRETKMKKVLARLEEIEKLQSDLRKIIPRKTTEQVIGRSSIERTGDRSSSDTTSDLDQKLETTDIECFELPMKKSVNDSMVQTKKQVKIGDCYVLDDSGLEESVTRSASPQSIKSTRTQSVFPGPYDSDLEDDIVSDMSIEEIGKMVHAFVQTKRKDQVHLEAFDLLDYFRFPEMPNEPSVNAIVQTFESPGSPKTGHTNVDFSDDTTKGIGKFVNVSVQTATKQAVATEPFDILNYFHLPDEVSRIEDDGPNKVGHFDIPSTSDKILKGPPNRTEIRPLGFPEIPKSSKVSKKRRNPSEKVPYNIEPVGSSPYQDVNLIGVGDKPRAAAVAWRTPAGSAKERQQVHASARKGASEGSAVVPGLGWRSQRTRGYQGDEVVRVPVRKHQRGTMMEWACPIGTGSRLAGKMRDRKENKLNQKQKKITRPQRGSVQQERGRMIGSMRPGRKWSGLWRKASDREETKEKPDSHDRVLQRSREPQRQAKHRRSLMKWTLAIATRHRLGDRRVTAAKRQQNLENELRPGLNDHHEQIMQSHEFCIGNQPESRERSHWKTRIKRFRWRSLVGCFNPIASRRRSAGVEVPDHYPGDQTPQLVHTESIDVLDRRTETLRVISSAAKVCIRRGNTITDNFFNRR